MARLLLLLFLLVFASPALCFLHSVAHVRTLGNGHTTRRVRNIEGVTLCSIGEDPLQERPSTAPRGNLIDGKYEVQRFYVRSDRIKELVAASFPFVLRLGTGALTSGWNIKIANDDPSKYAFARFGGYMTVEKSNVQAYPRPTQPVQLYEFEGCPFCRKVREAVAILDLDVEFKPCPMNGPTFRPEAIKMGGKSQFPFMLDPKTGKSQ